MNLTGSVYRAIVIGGGVVCVGLVVFAAVQRHAMSVADGATSDVRKQITAVQARLNQVTDASLLKEVSAKSDRSEEAAFLTFLRDAAASTHVQVLRLQSVAGGGDMMALVAKTADEKALLTGITPMAATLELQGSYSSLLRFTNRILSAPRLYNLNNLSWSRGKSPDETHLQLYIVRYVDPGTDTASPAASSAAGQVPKA